MPPDLLLIFKALITIDGVLSAIGPDFDLSSAMRKASLKIVAAKLSPDAWMPIVQSLAWELARTGENAPRLLRAAIRKLEADVPQPQVAAGQHIPAAARLIAGAIFLGALCISASFLWN